MTDHRSQILTPPDFIDALHEFIAEPRDTGSPAGEHGIRKRISNDTKVFLAAGYCDRCNERITVFDGQIHEQAAAPETSLAMNPHTAQLRGHRHKPDLAVPLHHCNIDTAEHSDLQFKPAISSTAHDSNHDPSVTDCLSCPSLSWAAKSCGRGPSRVAISREQPGVDTCTRR